MNKDSYEVRVYTGSEYELKGEFTDMEEAGRATDVKHTEQCDWYDIEEDNVSSYSLIICYRDDEHYNDIYYR